MGKYQAYPEYKDSGVEWLGKVPSHWKLAKHKYVASFIKGKNPAELLDNQIEGSLPYLSMDSLRGNVASKFAIPSKGMYIANLNQPLVIWDGSNAGEFVKGKFGILSSTMAAATLKVPMSQQYYWYLCSSIEPEMRKHANGMGIPHVNGEELKSIFLSIPSDDEQIQIASFLDHEIAKIDTLIDKQQQLIKLLKEKRQAVISHAVTKGLNPEAPMKDSGVEWLGEVPEHWKVTALKHLVSAPIIDGPHVSPKRCDTGIPFISAEAISNGKINFDKKWGYISEAANAQYSKRYSPQINDLLIVKLGATTGAIAIVETDKPFNIWVPLATVRTVADLDSKFVYYLFQSSQIADAIQQSWTFGTQQTLGLGTLSNLRIPVPPTDECKQIVIEIESKVVQFDEVINKSTVSLELLKERRIALISAAVTGKIDVRNWQSPVNQEAQQQEAG